MIAVKTLGVPTLFLVIPLLSRRRLQNLVEKPLQIEQRMVSKKVLLSIGIEFILSVLIDSANSHDSHLLLPHLEHIRTFLDRPKGMPTDSAWDC
jgi:hypothetical protein